VNTLANKAVDLNKNEPTSKKHFELVAFKAIQKKIEKE